MDTKEVLQGHGTKCIARLVREEDAAKVAAVLLQHRVWFEVSHTKVGQVEFFLEENEKVLQALYRAGRPAVRNVLGGIFGSLRGA